MFVADKEATIEQNQILEKITAILDLTSGNIDDANKDRWHELARELTESTPGYGCEFYCPPWHIVLHGGKILTRSDADSP